MFCTKCGKEVNENARFCSYCGASVPTAGQSWQSQPVQDLQVQSWQDQPMQNQQEQMWQGQPMQNQQGQSWQGQAVQTQQEQAWQNQPYQQQSYQFSPVQKMISRLKTTRILFIIAAVLQGIFMLAVIGQIAENSYVYYIAYYYSGTVRFYLMLFFFALLVGLVTNIIFAVMQAKTEKMVLQNPAGFVEKYRSATLSVVMLVVSILFGGVLAIVAAALNLGVRSDVNRNAAFFMQYGQRYY